MSESSDNREQLSDASVRTDTDHATSGESRNDRMADVAVPAPDSDDSAASSASGIPQTEGTPTAADGHSAEASDSPEAASPKAETPTPAMGGDPTPAAAGNADDNADDAGVDPIQVGDQLIPDFLRPPKRPEPAEPIAEDLPVRSVIPADSDVAYEVAPPQAHAHRNTNGAATPIHQEHGRQRAGATGEPGRRTQPKHPDSHTQRHHRKNADAAGHRRQRTTGSQPTTGRPHRTTASAPAQKQPTEASGAPHSAAGSNSAAAQTVSPGNRSRGMTIGILVAIAAVIAVIAVTLGSGALNTQDGAATDSQTAAQQSATGTSSGDDTTLSPSQVKTALKKIGLSSSEAKKAATKAQDDKRIAQIAANVDAYAREGEDVQLKLIELAVDDPEAVGFVLDWPDKYPTKQGEAYTDNVEKDTVPQLYQWDERWGYTTYSGTTFARTGCAPTALSMVYMGLTGKTDKTPYDMGQLAHDDGYESPHNGTVGDFLIDDAPKLGLSCQRIDIDAGTLTAWLKEGGVVICNVGAGDFTDGGHFIVITGMDKKGKLTIHDPYSSVRSAKHWSTSRILGQTIALYGFTAAE